MVVYMLATLILLSGLYCVILGFKESTPKQKIEEMHRPVIVDNIKTRYRVIGVLLIITAIIVFLKNPNHP